MEYLSNRAPNELCHNNETMEFDTDEGVRPRNLVILINQAW
jgi:hypothetical protein